jgi:hypothetical protein
MYQARRFSFRAQFQHAAKLEEIEGCFPFLRFDQIDAFLFDESLCIPGSLPGEELCRACRRRESFQQGSLFVNWLDGTDRNVKGDPVYCQTPIATPHHRVRSALPTLRNQMNGLAGLGQKRRDMSRIRSNPSSRIRGRWIFTAQNQML